MDILNVSIDANKTVGNNLILIGVRPYYRYEDGKKTDKVEGYRYDIADCRQTRCWDHPSTIFSFKVKLYPKIS